ncbi:MAG: hypothetical protein ACJ0F4_01895 [Gammaproteobacteria bacterium]
MNNIEKNLTTFKRLLLSLTLASLSSFIFSEVSLQTLDDFGIYSTSEHDLVVSKSGQNDRLSFFAFRMDRPFCICSNPAISIHKGDAEIETGSTLKGSIQVDMKKRVDTLFKVLDIFDSGHLLLRPLHFPTFRSSSVVKVKTEHGISETFITKGINSVMEQSKQMCESEFLFEYVEPKAEEMNV